MINATDAEKEASFLYKKTEVLRKNSELSSEVSAEEKYTAEVSAKEKTTSEPFEISEKFLKNFEDFEKEMSDDKKEKSTELNRIFDNKMSSESLISSVSIYSTEIVMTHDSWVMTHQDHLW